MHDSFLTTLRLQRNNNQAKLIETTEGVRRLGLAASLKADFLVNTAEFFTASEEA